MEGAAEGGIVVQDCLTLTHNLLRYNVSNQVRGGEVFELYLLGWFSFVDNIYIHTEPVSGKQLYSKDSFASHLSYGARG